MKHIIKLSILVFFLYSCKNKKNEPVFTHKVFHHHIINCDTLKLWVHSSDSVISHEIYESLYPLKLDSLMKVIALSDEKSFNINGITVSKQENNIKNKNISRLDVQTSKNETWVFYRYENLDDVIILKLEKESEFFEIFINKNTKFHNTACSIVNDPNFIVNLIENPKVNSTEFIPPND